MSRLLSWQVNNGMLILSQAQQNQKIRALEKCQMVCWTSFSAAACRDKDLNWEQTALILAAVVWNGHYSAHLDTSENGSESVSWLFIYRLTSHSSLRSVFFRVTRTLSAVSGWACLLLSPAGFWLSAAQGAECDCVVRWVHGWIQNSRLPAQ